MGRSWVLAAAVRAASHWAPPINTVRSTICSRLKAAVPPRSPLSNVEQHEA